MFVSEQKARRQTYLVSVAGAVNRDTKIQILFLQFRLIEFNNIVVFMNAIKKAGFTTSVLVTVHVKKAGEKKRMKLIS